MEKEATKKHKKTTNRCEKSPTVSNRRQCTVVSLFQVEAKEEFDVVTMQG